MVVIWVWQVDLPFFVWKNFTELCEHDDLASIFTSVNGSDLDIADLQTRICELNASRIRVEVDELMDRFMQTLKRVVSDPPTVQT